MTNNFYNVNISRYNPAEHTYAERSDVSNNQERPNTNPIEQIDNTVNEEINIVPSPSRLNALDSTILINEAYQNIDDEVFRTEYQIDRIETELKSVDKEIRDAYEINDLQKADVLTMRKHSLQARLNELNKNYGKSDVTTKLSGKVVSLFNKRPSFFSKILNSGLSFLSNKVLPKISKRYDSGVNIKSALNKLETLNKNVDELVTMQMPYGEADERYDMLSEYLNRANVIHFNISKTVGTPSFFDTISSIDQKKFSEARKNSSNFGNMTSKPTHHKMTQE